MRLAIAVTLTLLFSLGALAQGACCLLPDNGNGSADLPPIGCGAGYAGTMSIVNGLPAGSTIECVTTLTPLVLNNSGPGGLLGGTIQEWSGDLQFQMSGTGALLGFNRFITVPVSVITHSEPHPVGPVQVIDEVLFSLSGELFGDPDFCTFQIQAGNDFALPSPGQMTLGSSGPDWSATGYFDINYSITFQGCPGSLLDGHSGTTTDTRTHELCPGTVGAGEASMGSLKARFEHQ